MPRFRPRFSLLSAMLLMTIVGMAIVIVQLWREVGPLRAELRQLRNEVGRLTIEDETKIHAIEVRTNDDFHWKWRVWVPPGQNVVLRSQWSNVPRPGYTAGNSTIVLEPGEQWITLNVGSRITLNGRSSRVVNFRSAKVATAHDSYTTSIPASEHGWEWRKGALIAEGVRYTTKIEEDTESPFVLKRLRARPVNNSSSILNKNETAGIRIWLERR